MGWKEATGGPVSWVVFFLVCFTPQGASPAMPQLPAIEDFGSLVSFQFKPVAQVGKSMIAVYRQVVFHNDIDS